MTRRLCSIALLACLAGCDEGKDDPARLDHSVIPTAEHVRLVLDPAKEGYEGSVEIQLQVCTATDTIRFHGPASAIREVWIEADGQRRPMILAANGDGTLSAASAERIPMGTYSLHANFTNAYNRQGCGIYKVEYEGGSYLFTQMEPEQARHYLPCWDAPEFKIPWQFQLVVPTHLAAYGNTPIQSELPLEGGMKEVTFAESRPMPSYLAALAIGPFESVAMEALPVEGRIVVPAGKSPMAVEAARTAPPLLRSLEDYFGQPYPYRKLDLVAVPEFNYGAMENVGLITFRDTALLHDPQAITIGQRQWLAQIIAHEMAHMWFGNLVTLAWWDELWLNESFASWMALKTVNQTFPEYEMQDQDIGSREHAFDTDALATSRPIRQPVAATDDKANLFDSLAYNKGMAILDMVESWMGEEPFRQGIVHYMENHAWGNSDAFGLAAALEKKMDSEILAVMKSFTTQAGIPLVEFDRIDATTLRIRQSRYALAGDHYDNVPPWTIPLVLAYGSGGETHTQRVLIEKASQRVELEHAADWIHPNADERGYYRWCFAGAPLGGLADIVGGMDERKRMGFLNNAQALFRAGRLEGDLFLQTVARFASDPSPQVRLGVARILTGFPKGMVPPELDNAYGRFLHGVLRPVLDDIGIERRSNEHVLVEKLRPALIRSLGWSSNDPQIMETAAAMARNYMANPYRVDPSLAETYLVLAARHGDQALLDDYIARYEATTIPIEKEHWLKGLAGFRDTPLMHKVLDYALEGAVPPHQFRILPNGLADTDSNRSLVLAWVEENYPGIEAGMPAQHLIYLPWIACGQSAPLFAEAKQFFLAEEQRTQGIEMEMAKAQAVFDRSAYLREKEGPAIRRFLQTYQ